MTLPVTIPNTFANATTSIPLANLDANFVTIYDAVNGIGNGAESLANVTITGGTISNTSVSATTLNTSGQVVFNDAGADVDFRVEGDTDANLLFVDASTDRVGVGTNTPIAKLQIAGGANPYVVQNSGRAVYGIDINATAGADGAFGGAISLGTGGTGRSAIAAIQGPTGSDDDRNGLAFFVHGSSTSSADASEFMRLNGGYLRMASGTLGIQFNGDTAAANALDDYEEGTWTPVFSSGVTTPSYTATAGVYTKIGNLVTFAARMQASGGTANASHLIMGGLPFTSSSAAGTQGGAFFNFQDGFETNGEVTMHIGAISAGISFYATDGNNFAGTNADNVNASIHIQGHYYV